MNFFKFKSGSVPLLVSMPHTGTYVPPELAKRLTPEALALPDTDWHLETLYDFIDDLGASLLVATHSRYVVDLNRPPDDANLYPGQDTTGVVPVDTFHKQPLYLGAPPDAKEAEGRIEIYWKPYHAKLTEELGRLRDKHGYALLWDAHSIFSVLPRFFPGKLPDLNLGTADGKSCAPGIGESLLKEVTRYGAVLNGRFKGGYITRRYGNPAHAVHAIQLEINQRTYLADGSRTEWDDAKAARLSAVLRDACEALVSLGPSYAGSSGAI